MSTDDAGERTAADADSDLVVGDHRRPTSERYAAGVYRVVGAGDPVALLRVTDEYDQRQYTGDLVTVDAATVASDFEPADDPDETVDPVIEFRNVVSGMYWTVRKFLPR